MTSFPYSNLTEIDLNIVQLPPVWTRVEQNGETLFSCRLCRNDPRTSFNCPSHERSKKHQDAVNAANRQPSFTRRRDPLSSLVVEDGLRALVASGSSRPRQPLYPPGHRYFREPNFSEPGPAQFEEPSPASGINWHVLEAFGNTDAELSHEEQLRAQLCDISMAILNSDSDVDVGSGVGSSTESDEGLF